MKTSFARGDRDLEAEAARLLAARQLRRQEDRPAAAVITMSRLLRAVLHPDPVADQPVHAARRRDLGLERTYRDLLERHSLVFMPMAAAAASGAVTERNVAGYRIRIRPSASAKDRTFVVIELPTPERPPRLLECLLPLDEGQTEETTVLEQVLLPEPVDGAIQLMRRSDDPLVKALLDDRAQISLR